jgi:PAS domain S-box-containing protein
MSIRKTIQRWIDAPPVAGPDETRRRRLLYLLLAGIALVTTAVLLVLVVIAIWHPQDWRHAFRLGLIGLTVLVGIAALVLTARYLSYRLAAWLLLLLLILAVSLTGDPRDIVDGHALLWFAVPILIASGILHPWSGFVVAGIVGVFLVLLAISEGIAPHVVGIGGHFAIAGTAWAMSRSLERALRSQRVSEARYRAIVEDQTELICRFEPDGTVTFVNEAFCRFFGLDDCGQIVGSDLESVLSTLHLNGDDCADLFAAVCALQPHDSLDCRVLAGERERWVQWTGREVCNGQNQSVEHQIVGRDITAQVQAEVALRESQELYRSLVETSPDAIILTDLEGRIMASNRRFLEMYGFQDLGEMIEQGLTTSFDLIVPHQRPQAGESLLRTLQEGVVRGIEYEVFRRDDSTFPIELDVSLVRNASGEPRALMVVSRDITDRVRAEAALKERTDALRRLYRRLETVQEQERRRLAQVIHDEVIQQLVTLIYQAALLDISEGEIDALAQTVTQIGDRCRMLIRDLHPPELEWPLAEAIRALHTGALAMQVRSQTDPETEARFPPNLKLIAYRIIQEAVHNATRHSGGTEIAVDLATREDQLLFSVADNGCGFDPSMAEKPGHYGLTFMQERIGVLDGQLCIRSRAEGGMLVSGTIPIPQPRVTQPDRHQ